MKNILIKSQKDFLRLSKTPKLDDIFSINGFLRYFFYRNTLPAIRDIVVYLFDTLEIVLLYFLVGSKDSSGIILGYVFITFINSVWKVFVFSIREKVLYLNIQKKLDQLSRYFTSLLSFGTIFWTVLILTAIKTMHFDSKIAYLIFVHRAVSQVFELYSNYYFFTTYSLSRVFIPMQYTLLNRFMNLALAVFLSHFIGFYGFIVSFYTEKVLHSFITIRYCNIILRIKRIKLFSFELSHLKLKNLFWIFNENIFTTFKRLFSFVALNMERVLVLTLINNYFPAYIIDFFVFYHILNFLLTPANRIAKSLYFDITNLLYKYRYTLLRRLFNYSFAFTNSVAVVVVLCLYFVVNSFMADRWFNLLLEFTLINKWYSIYFLVFFAFGIRLLYQFFIVSESYIILILSVLAFDYLLIPFLFFNNSLYITEKNPLVYFFIRGNISVLNFIVLFILYLSGIWKKDSVISNLSVPSINTLSFIKRPYLKEQRLKGPLLFVVFSKKYVNSKSIQNFFGKTLSNMGFTNYSKISRNTYLFFGISELDTDTKLDLISKLGFFTNYISVSESQIPILFLYPFLGDNQIYKITDICKELDSKNIKYKKHATYKDYYGYYLNDFESVRKQQVLSTCDFINRTGLLFDEKTIFKKEFIGIVPIWENNRLAYILDAETDNQVLVKSLLAKIIYNETKSLDETLKRRV